MVVGGGAGVCVCVCVANIVQGLPRSGSLVNLPLVLLRNSLLVSDGLAGGWLRWIVIS